MTRYNPTRSLSLVLPWPPSVNRIWRAVAGRVVLSESARKYAVTCANALPTGPVDPLRGRLQVVMTLQAPAALANRCYYIANREKHVFDVLTRQRVWVDDSQIDGLMILRGTPQGAGAAILDITELP